MFLLSTLALMTLGLIAASRLGRTPEPPAVRVTRR